MNSENKELKLENLLK